MGIIRYVPHAVVLFLLGVGGVAVVHGEGGSSSGTAPAAANERISAQGYARLREELKAVEKHLVQGREELARLRHKWVVAKGRVPTEKEIKEFEENLAKGKATPQDNPYFNKNPLSTPAPARSAYFAKLEEVRRDEERARQLKEELAALDLKGGRR